MSSRKKVKIWFRNRFKSDKPSSAESKACPETVSSLQSSVGTDVTSLYSISPPVESPSPTIQDKVSPPHTSPPANEASGLVTICKGVDTAALEQDPWRQAVSFLDDDDQKLFESIDGHSDRETVFADLQKATLEKQRVSQEQAWKVTFGGRRIVLRDVIAKMTNWLNSYKEIGDLIAQADPVHVGLPWSAIKIVLSVFTADQEQMGLILIGLEQVMCLIARCSIYQQLYLGDAASGTKTQAQAKTELSNAMARLYAKIFSFLAYYLRLLDLNATLRTLKSFSQPGKVSEMLAEIGRYEFRVSAGANICEKVFIRPTLQQLGENAQSTRIQLREMMSKFDKEMIQLWKQLNEDERCKILQWVSDIPYESDHYIARKGRVSGTGEWLLCHDIYKAWRESEVSTLLWLNGIPGAGKTKLSTMVVDDLLTARQSESHDDTGLAYFYCDRNRADHNEPIAIIRSIVRQLCTPWEDTSIESCVEDRYLSRKAKGFASDRLMVEECKQLLFEMLEGFRNVYIVVDGLDECDRATRHILMDLLDDTMTRFNQSVKVYIASRTDQDLRKRYHEGTHLELTANDNQADIEKFVLDQMELSEFCRHKLTPTVRSKVLHTFRYKSQGMFQWATLHIGDLLQLETNADMEEYLDNLPKGLEAAYDKIFDRIAGQAGSKKRIAFAAFQAVMTSWRPLHPFELAIAVTQSPGRRFILDQDVDIGYVLDACQNLLIVTDGSQEREVLVAPKGWPPLDGYFLQEVKEDLVPDTEALWQNNLGVTKDSICKFAHLSVQEYLETKHWTFIEAHAFMAGICFRTLLNIRISEDTHTKSKHGCHKEDLDNAAVLYVSEVQKRRRVKVCPFVETGTETASPTSSPTKTIENTKRPFPNGSPDQYAGLSATPLIRLDDDGGSYIETPMFDAPPFECYVELVCPPGYDDDQSATSQDFEPFLEGHEGSPLEAWALYCAKGLSSHSVSQGVTGESRPTPGFTSQELLEEFLSTPSRSSSHYKAWVRLAQNFRDVNERSSSSRSERWARLEQKLQDLDERTSTDDSDDLDDSEFPSCSSPRTPIQAHTEPARAYSILGFSEILESWLSKQELDSN